MNNVNQNMCVRKAVKCADRDNLFQYYIIVKRFPNKIKNFFHFFALGISTERPLRG